MSETSKEIIGSAPNTAILRDIALLPARKRTKQQVDETIVACADWIDRSISHTEKLESVLGTLSSDYIQVRVELEHMTKMYHYAINREVSLFSKLKNKIFRK